MDPLAQYTQIGRLIETAPNLTLIGAYSPEVLQWLGRAFALVEASGDAFDVVSFRTEMDNASLYQSTGMDVPRRGQAIRQIFNVLARCQARVELKLPASAQGAFIAAGNAFDAMAAFAKVASGAKSDLMIVDPYMDEKTLTDFAPTARENVSVRLLADASHAKPSLAPAVTRWTTQYANRPMSARLAAARTLHDRLIIVDRHDVWIITQSLNAIATRSPASIVRVDGDTRAEKIAAYEAIWEASASL